MPAPVIPRSLHHELRTADNRLIGEMKIACPFAAAELARKLLDEMPEIGRISLLEVEEVLVVERHTRERASFTPGAALAA